jgi:hypothetical protein
MKKGGYLFLFLGVALLFSLTGRMTQAQTPLFSDVPSGYWAEEYILSIYNARITAGYGDGTYGPEDLVTREQMATFITRALYQVPVEGYCGTVSPFPDVAFDHWSCKSIKKLYELGITTGYGDGRFGPEDLVTREQMAAFLTRTMNQVPADGYCGTANPFPDVGFDRWSCKYVKKLAELGITSGYGDGRFGPGDYVTRAQMAAFLSRAFLGLEPYSYLAYLQYGGPLETIFTLQKPKGWEVIISGMCSTLAFLIRDPNEPLRQIFYFGSVRPVYLTQDQKNSDQFLCSLVQPPCPLTWTDAPVVSPLTVANFFAHWPEIASMQNAAAFMSDFPRLHNIQLISVTPQSPMLAISGAQTSLVRGVFADGDLVNPTAAQGQFLATVAADPFGSGTGSGYMVFGATAPVQEFKFSIDKMVESLNSFAITDVYFNWCVAQSQQQWGAVAAIGQTLSEASDMIMEGWLNRTATQDIKAYEYNNALNGMETVWDPATGSVYQFEAGWYDQYALNPGAYNISTLAPMPDNRVDLWEGTIIDGPTHVYPQ